MIRNLQEGPTEVQVQETTFSIDVLGRYICNTYEEAVNNGGFPFDTIVIGAGMYGAYVAEKIYRQGQGNLRVLVLEAGSFLVSEHVQNLSRIGLNPAGPITNDPGVPRERVWGLPWRSSAGFPGLAYCVGGRSLYWGGWAPRMTDADLKNWPKELQTYLKGNYGDTEKEIGADPVTDFISGDLYEALSKALKAAAKKVPTVDGVEVAPLAVQGGFASLGLVFFRQVQQRTDPDRCDPLDHCRPGQHATPVPGPSCPRRETAHCKWKYHGDRVLPQGPAEVCAGLSGLFCGAGGEHNRIYPPGARIISHAAYGAKPNRPPPEQYNRAHPALGSGGAAERACGGGAACAGVDTAGPLPSSGHCGGGGFAERRSYDVADGS